MCYNFKMVLKLEQRANVKVCVLNLDKLLGRQLKFSWREFHRASEYGGSDVNTISIQEGTTSNGMDSRFKLIYFVQKLYMLSPFFITSRIYIDTYMFKHMCVCTQRYSKTLYITVHRLYVIMLSSHQVTKHLYILIHI